MLVEVIETTKTLQLCQELLGYAPVLTVLTKVTTCAWSPLSVASIGSELLKLLRFWRAMPLEYLEIWS